MSSHSQTTSIPSSNVMPLPLDPRPIFELNQARRAKLTLEVETLRSAFLERPTAERLEAFVEKKVEYDEMMEDQVEFFRTAAREQRVYVEAKERAARLAEERHLQEFQRALERMNPAEAEAAQQAERERLLRLQKEREARATALNARIAHERARVQAKFPFDFERL